jgi:Asp-tRNA(Asn)/Glu-tRNA(Gln) amidotransferase B subunit
MLPSLEMPFQDASRKFAERSVKENPRLVEQYFAGQSTLEALVRWAMDEARGSVNPRLVGEWLVLELIELHRSRSRAGEGRQWKR